MINVFREFFSFSRKCLTVCWFTCGVVFVFVVANTIVVNSAVAKEFPVWEAGVGTAGLSMSHYLGADESGRYGFAYPFFIYRREYVQADREGLRGKLFHRDNLRLNISLNA